MSRVNLLYVALFYVHLVANTVHIFLPVFLPLGQVKQMALEAEEEQEQPRLTHITIPAAYKSGITLFALRESGVGQELSSTPELLLL